MRARWADHAINLAVFRITVFGVLLLVPEVYQAPTWATLPLSMRVPPFGLGWAASLTVNPLAAKVALVALVVCSALAMVGLWTRVSTAIATILGVGLLALPQLSGSVLHLHHLIWFAALLAASPCGDALSVDAWRAHRKGQALDVGLGAAYGLPIRAAWLMIAFIFLFPGIAKWRESGIDWALSDNLVNQLHWKWRQFGEVPGLRVDLIPALCQAAALAVLIFEPGFMIAVMFRRSRLWAVAAAVVFHCATDYFFHIRFTALLACYTVFFDWSWLARLVPGGSPSTRALKATRTWLPTALVAGVLAVGNAWCGFRAIDQAWPFACYPTFAERLGPRMPMLWIDADGQRVDLDADLRGREGQIRWGQAWALGSRADPAALADSWQQVVRRHPELAGTRRVRFYVAWVWTAPEDAAKAPEDRVLLAELPPRG